MWYMMLELLQSYQNSCIGTLMSCGTTAEVYWLVLSLTLLQGNHIMMLCSACLVHTLDSTQTAHIATSWKSEYL